MKPLVQPTSKSTKRTFWNSCPRKLGFFPETPCALGKACSEGKPLEAGCAWYINSDVDKYCFWTWVRRVSDSEGFMEPLLQHEMSSLLASSSTKIHATYKEALEKIKQFPEYEELREIFTDP